MFWKTFFNLCENRNTKPLPVVKELHISEGSITKWKNGSIPKVDALLKIADYFDVSVDYLIRNATESTEIATARKRVMELHQTRNDLIKNIENYFNTNYHTFRAWCHGYGDFFNNKITLLAEFYGVSCDYLLGLTDNPKSYSDADIKMVADNTQTDTIINKPKKNVT